MMKLIVTGGAGFIGSHLTGTLLQLGHQVTCIDNFDNFYDPEIKERNIRDCLGNENFTLIHEDILEYDNLLGYLHRGQYDAVIHLAAKAGVRPSIDNPLLYHHVNVVGTNNMLELAKTLNIKKFILGSSSSVYGINPNVPWNEDDHVLRPISPYASSKVAAELLGHVYSQLYGIQFIALRFFTVYGPRQRPDLAIHKFCKNIASGKSISVYGSGTSKRDYTYVEDLIKGILAALAYNKTGYVVINLGNNKTVEIRELIAIIEDVFGVRAKIQYCDEKPGDVPQTYADITKAKELLNYHPEIDIEEGIKRFRNWMVISK